MNQACEELWVARRYMRLLESGWQFEEHSGTFKAFWPEKLRQEFGLTERAHIYIDGPTLRGAVCAIEAVEEALRTARLSGWLK